MAEFTYSITEPIGVLSNSGRRSLELNMISWNDKPAKYDLRRWQSDGNAKIMSKGISFDEGEARELYELLRKRFAQEACCKEGDMSAHPADQG